MSDVRLLIQEEGRTARNLVAFNVPLSVTTSERVTRKPPSVPRPSSSASLKRSMKNPTRVRSASTGRDKKSELQARHWAFLFGNLQRAVDGIYQTCEDDENISECKEAILVLENYTRDFHNLIEWFKVKWAYESSSPPLRTAPLAWEVRKTSPCRKWNSSTTITSKCSSPHQRLSPIDYQINNANNNNIRDQLDYKKKIKDSKNNNVSKKDTNNIKDKNNLREKQMLKIPNKTTIKSSSSSSIVRANSMIKNNRKFTNNNINLTKNINNEIKDNKDDEKNKIIDTSCSSNKKSINNSNDDEEKLLNKMNNLLIIDKDRNINKNSSTQQRTNRYSSVSRMNKSVEIPKMYRSKTTLSVKDISSVNKARPGSSVMIRKRNDYCNNNNNDNQNKENTGSVEVLTKQSVKNKKPIEDSDGWQTVRSRCRRGSSHSLNMSTRFYRPTTATSLPALSIDNSNDKYIKKNIIKQINTTTTIENTKINYNDVLKNNINNNNNNSNNNNVNIDIVNNSNDDDDDDDNRKNKIICETNSTSMIAAVFKSEANLLEKKIQQFMAAQAERERIILEEERKTEEADSQRSQQLSDEEAFLKKQIQELEQTVIDVDTETDETDCEMVLEIEDDNNHANNKMNDDDGVGINVGVGIDVGDVVGDGNGNNVIDDISLEDRYENMLVGMSFSERIDTLAQLKALVARHPGRALELHQKLSSPSRKRSLPETLRRYQAKQACAQHKRQKLLDEKSQRLRELLNKVEDVKRAKNQLTEDKRLRMEIKLKRAEENRTQHLLEIVRKAHDEESKLKEIAFINELEAQNKRHDFMALCQEQEERLQSIQEERQRRQEEKAAKEAAAEERRRAIEADRQLKIQKMQQARQEREERVGKMQLEREKERQEIAREKARDREERLSALHAAQLANQEELQKKIAQKQQESARRHVENIENIRQRAFESSIIRLEEIPPTLKSYNAHKQCTLCTILIPNEVCLLSHLKGKTHIDAVKKIHDGREPSRDELQKFNISHIKDTQIIIHDNHDNKIIKEKQKAIKRRCRKLKQRMTSRGQELENLQNNNEHFDSVNKSKLRRNLKELDRLCDCHGKTTWSNVAVSGLERCLGEIGRVFNKIGAIDQDVFRSLNGFKTLTSLLNLSVNIQNNSHYLPNKSIVSIFRVYKAAVVDHPANIESIILSNKILVILDLLLQRFEAVTGLDEQGQIAETTGNLHTGNGSGSIIISVLQLLCCLIPHITTTKNSMQNRIHDIIGFLITGGLVDRITRHNRVLIEADYFIDQEHESQILLLSYDLLSRLCCYLKKHDNNNLSAVNNDNEQTTVETHLLGCLQLTEAAGVIGYLYSTFALANQKLSSPGQNSNSNSNNNPSYIKLLAIKSLKLLKNIALIDLQVFQKLLGNEGTSLQWRHISSHMITRFLREPIGDLNDSTGSRNSGVPSTVTILLELFSVLGYFAVNNTENQLVLQTAGTGPSVLQHLCTLPFPFYNDPKLAVYTLPTLLAATHRNSNAISILSCEMSYQLLEEYKNSEEGKVHPLIQMLKET
ncbi:hypothetical protein HCN44_008560 [Aphidius gifuensis]|uniref:S phase cyclin A-associated protein in the endoplasmic reticulum N-terminal domain-containing protein n=1 Tax=Aphidius gifuensis TaxID=684658 RepID=A0A834XPS1_APHGI|nr:S phase cyclin A-associated protein in the endoplasmic reticulum [Aphidius gifuensis]KAF7989886.1 hypothetical protein HCN44_008560 [Aphidius gifuensis]